ncbi:SMC-Scp complex subunit ScpB [Kibdelosporangium aridum]|uniref:SMC-Scp complex subunit ScpB n=2 Tax=Kibdelosporangium aridum TaxID=2030 RepID=A0A428YPB1_KIBAR|nr:SMC-Scp complex subunit ScpB [Kibdelosporangium aridum]
MVAEAEAAAISEQSADTAEASPETEGSESADAAEDLEAEGSDRTATTDAAAEDLAGSAEASPEAEGSDPAAADSAAGDLASAPASADPDVDAASALDAESDAVSAADAATEAEAPAEPPAADADAAPAADADPDATSAAESPVADAGDLQPADAGAAEGDATEPTDAPNVTSEAAQEAEAADPDAEATSAAADAPALDAKSAALPADTAATIEATDPATTGDTSEDTAFASRLPDLTEDEALHSALEALLLVVDSPAEVEMLADALDEPVKRIRAALKTMAAQYTEQNRGIDLRDAGGGWRFYTRDKYAPFVEKLLHDGQRAKLTRAALESLAVIAYRQPVTRARVAAVRGVNVDGVIRTLLVRGLIEETGTDKDTGGILYRTTELFLERLGLSSLEDLPPIAPLLPEVDAIDDV